MVNFVQPTAIGALPLGMLRTQEQRFVERHKGTHMTLREICDKYKISKPTAEKRMGMPDLIANKGNFTKLYARARVVEIMEVWPWMSGEK